MYLYGWSWWWGIIHISMTIAQMKAYTLALHVSSHRPTWKFAVLDAWLPVFLGPFLGQTVYTYYFHHIKMHHVADNGLEDCSSTLLYQRDNPWHFAQ
jgi:hypothetical protein